MDYITQNWSFDPFLIVVAVLVVAHEVGLARLRRRSDPGRTRSRRLHSLAFYGGLGVLLLAIDSPIDYWAGDYFFVHMIEHLLIAFYAPILIVLGAPWIPLLFALPVGARRKVGRVRHAGVVVAGAPADRAGSSTSPWFALISFNLVMVVWHLPALFDYSRDNQVVHIWLMHGSFFVTGVLFWLQIIPLAPVPARRPARSGRPERSISTNVVMFVLAMALSIFTAHQLVPGLRPPAGCDPVARSPTSRSVRPSCGCAATSGRCRPWSSSSSGPSTRRAPSPTCWSGCPTAVPPLAADLRPQRAGAADRS